MIQVIEALIGLGMVVLLVWVIIGCFLGLD